MASFAHRKVFPYELIGEEIEVIRSKNKSNQGIKGKITDETKSTIMVEHHGKVKRLFKTNITFRLLKSKEVIAGETIIKRPEERIKG